MKIIRLNGTDKKLYELVAPLVMNATVLRQNNNYPFKTSPHYIWHLMLETGVVVGFIPLKNTTSGYCIDNYYSTEPAVLEKLLDDVLSVEEYEELNAVVHKRDVELFKKKGFSTMIEWTKYSKMIKEK